MCIKKTGFSAPDLLKLWEALPPECQTKIAGFLVPWFISLVDGTTLEGTVCDEMQRCIMEEWDRHILAQVMEAQNG